MGTSEDRTAAL